MNIHKWITASLIKHFKANVSTPLYYHGENPNLTKGKKSYFELRIDGPSIKQPSRTYFKVYVEVNVLISVYDNEGNIYKIENLIGEISAAFNNTIPVYKLPEDTLVGCLTLNKDGIFPAKFGEVDPDLKLQQATVEGHYEIQLETLE